jgi:hypothetical protein
MILFKRAMMALFLAAAVAAAAGVDGRWKAEFAAPKQPKANRKGSLSQKPEVILELKSAGAQLEGTVTSSAGKRARPIAISDGKIEGDRFSFTTVQRGKKAETKWTWRGTVNGDQITGTRSKEGARRGQSFTAKRQS